jgi:hypothetical protein
MAAFATILGMNEAAMRRTSLIWGWIACAGVACGGTVERVDAAGAGGGSSQGGAGGGTSSSTAGGVGGDTGGSPEAASFAPASDQALLCDWHTATAIGGGRVLIVGACLLGDAAEPADALVYTYATRTFVKVSLKEPRQFHSAVRIADGRVALVGAAPHIEYFSPDTGTSELGPALLTPRTEPTLAAIPGWEGYRVMGGFDDHGASLASTEIVVPGTDSFAGQDLLATRARAVAVPTGSAGVWIAGGESTLGVKSPTQLLTSTESSFCPHAEFTQGPALQGAPGNIALAPSGEGALVASGTWSTFWDGTTLQAPLDHEQPAYFPGAAATESGRFVVVGMVPWQDLLRALLVKPGKAAKVFAERPGTGVVTTVTALQGDTVLVISGSASLLTLPP